MRKLLFALIFVLAFAGFSQAAPFLICDNYPTTGNQPDTFTVTIDGTNYGTPAYKNADGSVKLHYDLASLAAGSHTVTAVACSALWGCSAASSPFPFVKSVPGAPTTITIQAQ